MFSSRVSCQRTGRPKRWAAAAHRTCSGMGGDFDSEPPAHIGHPNPHQVTVDSQAAGDGVAVHKGVLGSRPHIEAVAVGTARALLLSRGTPATRWL